jgi:hypothetical protein
MMKIKKTMMIFLLIIAAAGWALIPAQRADAQTTQRPRSPRTQTAPAPAQSAPQTPAPAPSTNAAPPPVNAAPPPLLTVQYNVAVNGQAAGPFNMEQLRQMAAAGQFTPQSLVWKQGMAQWAAAGTVQELAPVFALPAGVREFSTGRRVGMAALNPVLGLGSYLMGDWVGGAIVTGLEVATVSFVFWELSLVKDNDEYLVPGALVFVTGGLAVVFGIIEPFLYHRTPQAGRTAALLKGLDIGLVQAADIKTPPGVRVSYSFQL